MTPSSKLRNYYEKLCHLIERLNLNFLLLLFVFTISFVIDRLTKSIIASLALTAKVNGIQNLDISILPFFNIVFVINDGVSFGIFAGLGAKHYLIFLSVIISGIIFYMLYKEKLLVNKIAYCFILSGALGNLFDRISIGGVVDFLDFYITISQKQYHWPAFNIADSSIFIGVVILLLSNILYPEKAKQISLPTKNIDNKNA